MAKRRQFIVDRSFQFKYTLLIALIGGAVSAIFALWMWDATRTSAEILLLGDIPGAELLREQLRADQAHLPWLYVGITLLMMAALGLLGILITHRVAGPAFVMGRYLGLLADGVYPSLRPLRKRDELKGFFDSFERAVTMLKNRDKDEADKLDEVIAKLETSGAAADQLDLLRSIRDRKRESVAGALREEAETSSEKTDEDKEKAAS